MSQWHQQPEVCGPYDSGTSSTLVKNPGDGRPFRHGGRVDVGRPSRNAVTKSVAAHLAVDVISILVMLWALVLFFRVLLRESSKAAAKNPRPW